MSNEKLSIILNGLSFWLRLFWLCFWRLEREREVPVNLSNLWSPILHFDHHWPFWAFKFIVLREYDIHLCLHIEYTCISCCLSKGCGYYVTCYLLHHVPYLSLEQVKQHVHTWSYMMWKLPMQSVKMFIVYMCCFYCMGLMRSPLMANIRTWTIREHAYIHFHRHADMYSDYWFFEVKTCWVQTI